MIYVTILTQRARALRAFVAIKDIWEEKLSLTQLVSYLSQTIWSKTKGRFRREPSLVKMIPKWRVSFVDPHYMQVKTVVTPRPFELRLRDPHVTQYSNIIGWFLNDVLTRHTWISNNFVAINFGSYFTDGSFCTTSF